MAFYDPLIFQSGKIAEEYGVSVSDVLGLLLAAGKDEAGVRALLDEANRSPEARSAAGSGRTFDLVGHARSLLASGATGEHA